VKWYLPSWNGDFRLENVPVLGDAYRAADGGASADGAGVRLLVTAATPHEREILNGFLAAAVKEKWTAVDTLPTEDCEIMLATTMAKAGASLVQISKPMDRTITAVSFENGRLKVVDAAESGAIVAAAEKAAKKDKDKAAKAAATVSRPTPSCPQCVPGSIAMASEVLQEFLTPSEHDDWARHRAILVEGGFTGRRYIIAHRHSPVGQRFGRICYALDDQMVVHFHDRSVPPEEEVLAAKLILEHREHWLRNEATMLGSPDAAQVFKNPFGGAMDGVADSQFTEKFGYEFARLLGIKLTKKKRRRYTVYSNPG
jgi:hypothetical protein